MGNTVPVLSKDLDEFVFDTTDGWLHVATCSMQGWRSENEDEHLAEKLSGVDDHFFIGVFDGHGGKAASAFTRKHMVNSLIEREEWKLYCNNPQADGAMALLGDALKSSFIDVDNLLIDFKEKRDQSGTTACCCVVTPTFIVCANAGDSRAVLETGQGVRNLSEDHKPGSFRERERIEAAGGMVYNGRVDRELGVARAIGDFKYKRADDLPPSKQRVTCVPDITLHVRASGDSLLVIACDGVWDVLSSSAALGVAKSAELALQVACETAGNEQHESRNPGKGEGVVGGSKSKSQVWDTEGPDAMIRPSRALSSRRCVCVCVCVCFLLVSLCSIWRCHVSLLSVRHPTHNPTKNLLLPLPLPLPHLSSFFITNPFF
jgi:serine/threonine protein phosphatase PrpC